MRVDLSVKRGVAVTGGKMAVQSAAWWVRNLADQSVFQRVGRKAARLGTQ